MIVQNFSAMGSRSDKDSLAALKDRYNELREIGEGRIILLQEERDSALHASKELQQQLQLLREERDSALNASKELQQQLQLLQEERDSALNASKELRQQLQLLREERDSALHASKELQEQLSAQAEINKQAMQIRVSTATQLATLEAECTKCKEERDALAGEKAALTKATEGLEQQLRTAMESSALVETLEQALNEARQDNELLVVQLHNVQEELEHYFLLSEGAGLEPETTFESPMTHEQDMEVINTNRSRLLAAV